MNGYWMRLEKGLDNLPDAKLLRQAVFVEEQGFHDEFDETDPAAYHLVIYRNETPAATGRVFEKEPGHFIIGRVAVAKRLRGEGYGRLVMNTLENQARVMGAGSVSLSAQLQARCFYEALGYQAYGKVYLDQGCPHISMRKAL